MVESIPVTFTCPGFFMGKSGCKPDSVHWVHSICKREVFIDSDGDVTCSGSCYIPSDSRFIQNWRFSCSNHLGEYLGYASISDMMQAIANASHALTNYYGKGSSAAQTFLQKLAINITKRWT